ncbi:methyltransferase domain-containing protein [Akkermansiaceae bacterium]|nr:methyltransferase domain-containing protein [Akkermansiaceae bacterium]
MTPFPPLPTELLHALLRYHIAPGDLAIDATAGNGFDTIFLAECVGETGRVIAIDIQEPAISATRVRLDAAGLSGRVALHHGTHVDLAEFAAGGVPSVIVFNLGYLPGGDSSVITRTEETLAALRSAIGILAPGGILAVTCYPAHPGGDAEAHAVEQSISTAPELRTARYGLIAKGKPAPFILLSCKQG